MANKFIVDAHALIWYLEGNSRLGKAAKDVLDDSLSRLVLPVIALAEVIFVVEKGKTLILDAAALINRVQNDVRFEIHSLTFQILQTGLNLTAIPEMHDRLIVATGIYLQNSGETVKILTKDNEIILSAFLPVVWS